MILNELERRILGVLVEKAKTTPDAYPLSVNALVTGSNQKSNRDPLMNVDDVDIEEALDGLKKSGLVTQITGGRVERWRHNLYEVWQVGKVELAILAELLLRGAQTLGELRTRAGRMEKIESLEVLRDWLQKLDERKMIVFLGDPERRGAQVTHHFYDEAELDRIKSNVTFAPTAAPPPARPSTNELNELRDRVASLETTVAQLQEELQRMQSELGEN